MADENVVEREAEHAELIILRARIRGVDQLTKAYAECQRENETLRSNLLAYDQVLLRVQNRLECFASRGEQASGSPNSSRAFISSLLSDNQTLKQRVAELEQRLQGSGLAELQERHEALEMENRALRAELEDSQPLLEILRGDVSRIQSGLQPFALAEQLVHMQRAAKTKEVMCEALTAELVATQQQLVRMKELEATVQELKINLQGKEPANKLPGILKEPTEQMTDTIMAEIERYKLEAEKMLKENSELKQEGEEWRAEALQQKEKAGTYLAELKVVKSEGEEWRAEALQQKEKADTYLAELEVVKSCFQGQNMLSQLQSNLVTLKEQHQQTKREMAAMRILHTQKVHELEDELSRMNDERVSFISQIDLCKSDFEEERSDRQKLMKENKELQTALTNLSLGGYQQPNMRGDLVAREGRRNPIAGLSKVVTDAPGELPKDQSGQQ